MNLSQLRPSAGSTKNRTRKGRGAGSGKGGTSTRGHKGAQSRSGYSQKFGFEGGQMPLQRRVPKFGFKNPNRVEYKVLNLDLLAELAGQYPGEAMDLAFFINHGLSGKRDRIKILGRGELTTALTVVAHAFSGKAKEIIEQAGGKATLLADQSAELSQASASPAAESAE